MSDLPQIAQDAIFVEIFRCQRYNLDDRTALDGIEVLWTERAVDHDVRGSAISGSFGIAG